MNCTECFETQKDEYVNMAIRHADLIEKNNIDATIALAKEYHKVLDNDPLSQVYYETLVKQLSLMKGERD